MLVRSRVATMAPTTISPFARVCTNAETLEQVQHVRDHAEQQHRRDGAGDAAAAAGERGAAEHHGDDGVELEALAGVRIAGAEPAGDEQATPKPAPMPDNMKASKRTRSMSTPARRALSASPPVASRCRPKRVRVSTTCASAANPTSTSPATGMPSTFSLASHAARPVHAPTLRSVYAKITPCSTLERAEGQDQRFDAQAIDQPAMRDADRGAPIATIASAAPAPAARAGRR